MTVAEVEERYGVSPMTARRDLAEAAVAMLTPRETLFLDSSTTTYCVARRLVEAGLAATVLTNSLPMMELLFREGEPQPRVARARIAGVHERRLERVRRDRRAQRRRGRRGSASGPAMRDRRHAVRARPGRRACGAATAGRGCPSRPGPVVRP